MWWILVALPFVFGDLWTETERISDLQQWELKMRRIEDKCEEMTSILKL
uniref:SOAR domain-containing protein n=1 Tax=Heterorhabditis bacteriophora TaxID=37862 RepID=A0A1I7X4W0_HETBA